MKRDEAFKDAIQAMLLEALKARDPYTYGHSKRVAYLARELAKSAGLSELEQHSVEYAALFHDLGKIGIPDRVLLKPDRLTTEEAAIMRLHPIKSAEILTPLLGDTFFEGIVPSVRAHHERMDGRGYPYGLEGNEIPLGARILLIADTFDAMTTNRPYRSGQSSEFAYRELRLFAGRQFDAHLVRIFVQAHPSWAPYDSQISQSYVADMYRKAA